MSKPMRIPTRCWICGAVHDEDDTDQICQQCDDPAEEAQILLSRVQAIAEDLVSRAIDDSSRRVCKALLGKTVSLRHSFKQMSLGEDRVR